MSWFWYPLMGVLLFAYRFVSDRDKERERTDLLADIRKELDEVKDDILEEIRSASVNRRPR